MLAVIAHTATPTNTRLGIRLSPAQALIRLRAGDVALGRLDVLPSLDGVEAGLWALDVLEERGVKVLNRRTTLTAAHDKLETARTLHRAGLPHPRTAHVAPWLPLPEVAFPVVLKPRFGSWGRDVTRCDSPRDLDRALALARHRVWFNATGGVVQELVPPSGYDLRIIVAGGRMTGAIVRRAALGEWRTNVALGGRRVRTRPSGEACVLALAAAAAVGGDLVGVDLLPVPGGDWTVIEVNGAVDFNSAYSLDDDVFTATRDALILGRNPLAEAYSYA